MPNHGAFLPIHLLHLENITFHGASSPPQLSSKFLSQNSYRSTTWNITFSTTHSPYRELVTSTPTTHSDHLSQHCPVVKQHLHFVSRCSIHCCQYILSAHARSWPSPGQFQRNSCKINEFMNSLILLSFLQQKKKLDPYNPQKGCSPCQCYPAYLLCRDNLCRSFPFAHYSSGDAHASSCP